MLNLEKCGVNELNQLQLNTIDQFNTPKDLLLMAPTGSGKTIAYLYPCLTNLQPDKTTQLLVVCPTRELCLQIYDVAKKLRNDIKITALYGGHDKRTEINNLIEKPDVVVATPGRLCDHLDLNHVQLDKLFAVVWDEFDKTLEFGFLDQIGQIFNRIHSRIKNIFVSATGAVDIPSFFSSERNVINHLNCKTQGTLERYKIATSASEKSGCLAQLLKSLSAESSIVFCNHREAVDRILKELNNSGLILAGFHGGKDQHERDRAIIRLRMSAINALITTDLASRGIDISGITNVIHYQIPDQETVFIHRNGRTARMDNNGSTFLVYSDQLPGFINSDDYNDFNFIPTQITMPIWECIYVGLGKKDKVNKIDLVGFFIKQLHCEKEEIGLIEVRDKSAFVAVLRTKAEQIINLAKGKKIKGKSVLIRVCY